MGNGLLELVRNSELWSVLYGLPLIPMHSNPNIYLAIIMLCLGGQAAPLQQRAEAYFQSCVAPDTYYRWPDGRGGNFSHDEVLGAAAYSQIAAVQLYDTLESNDGYFPDEHGKFDSINRYFYRHPFLKPYLRARIGMEVGVVSQSLWSAHVIWSMIMNKRHNFDPDGLLKIWLMGQAVKNYEVMNYFYEMWKKVMKSRGIGPKMIFTDHYLNEARTMREIAPVEF